MFDHLHRLGVSLQVERLGQPRSGMLRDFTRHRVELPQTNGQGFERFHKRNGSGGSTKIARLEKCR